MLLTCSSSLLFLTNPPPRRSPTSPPRAALSCWWAPRLPPPPGKGRIIELPGPVIDPETFAQDIRRLMGTDKVEISLWNALTVIAVPYGVPGGREKLVELINYAQEPIPVQVRIKGAFSSVLYETPDRACCESLTPVQRGEFTEFVVPSLRIAGRVHLTSRRRTAP